MAAPPILFTDGVLASYPHSMLPRLLIPATSHAYAAGYDAINSYEPVEHHGYRISY